MNDAKSRRGAHGIHHYMPHSVARRRRHAPHSGSSKPILLAVLLGTALCGVLIALVVVLIRNSGGSGSGASLDSIGATASGVVIGPTNNDIPLPLPTCAEASERLLIALTNDDGYNAPRTVQLATHLRAAGHRVVILAPDAGASGSSSRLIFFNTTLLQHDVDTYSAYSTSSGATQTPAATVFFVPQVFSDALQPAEDARLPDVIISGINIGWNAGPDAILSGTVGAIVGGALTRFIGEIPGIAVSADIAASGDDVDAGSLFIVDLLGALRCSDYAQNNGGRLLPPSIGLNVQLPLGMGKEAPRGARLARSGASATGTAATKKRSAVTAPAATSDPNVFTTSFTILPAFYTDDFEDSDSVLVTEGYIAITPIIARLDAPQCDRAYVYDMLLGTAGATPCSNGTVPDPIAASGFASGDIAATAASFLSGEQLVVARYGHAPDSCCTCSPD